ncbi:MAG TPA: hypothetical protein VKQ31_11255 [Steroidobacteraceae bacterium]|nr:hypothetical protein [Steroidobacteraceae bacterium]
MPVEKPADSASAAAADPAGTQTLELMDPERLLAGSEAPAAAPQIPADAAPQILEVDPDAPLALEDPAAVEKILSAPPPAAPLPSPPLASTAARSSDDSMLANGAAAAADTPAFVPLAKRASLSAAAKKLAAASTAAPVPESKPLVPAKPVAPSAPVTALKPHAAPAATPAAEAPSLASWANARAAAAASARHAGAPSGRAPVPAPGSDQPAPREKPRTAPPAAPAAASVPAAAPAAATAARGMDRDFIARNQVVERYLLGKLPIKAATDFERYCKEHPELLDELGLPERVNAGLRLLEASGKPEPWQEESRPLWQQPMVTFGLAGLTGVLALSLALVAASSAGKTHKILDLQTQVTERTLDPAASTRVIRLMPNRSGATNAPAITIGGGREAQLADLRIDESRSPYRDFRVTVDRIDQGRVMIIDNLTKDSNGHLRIALNSSALGPGNYLFTIEGLTTRLEPQPDSWVTIGVAQR